MRVSAYHFPQTAFSTLVARQVHIRPNPSHANLRGVTIEPGFINRTGVDRSWLPPIFAVKPDTLTGRNKSYFRGCRGRSEDTQRRKPPIHEQGAVHGSRP
jgi:hypothetical protein